MTLERRTDGWSENENEKGGIENENENEKRKNENMKDQGSINQGGKEERLGKRISLTYLRYATYITSDGYSHERGGRGKLDTNIPRLRIEELRMRIQTYKSNMEPACRAK